MVGVFAFLEFGSSLARFKLFLSVKDTISSLKSFLYFFVLSLFVFLWFGVRPIFSWSISLITI